MTKPFISVCVPFYPWYRQHDRSEEVFTVLIPALVRAGADNFELSIVDGGVTDIWGLNRAWDGPAFEARLRRAWPGRLVYTCTDAVLTPATHARPHRFWVAAAVNAAIRQSTSEYVFINNIDIEVPPDFCARYFEHVGVGRAWFPFCYNIRADMPRQPLGGGWRSARGLVGITAADYWAIGGTDEAFIKDRHDSDLYERVKARYAFTNEPLPGLFHIDHPGTNEGTSAFKGTWPRQPLPVDAVDLMIVAAHADDEGIFFGAAAATYAAQGRRVQVVCMTAVPNSVRAQELERACAVYGCLPPVCAGFTDRNERDPVGGREVINLERSWRLWGGAEPPTRYLTLLMRRHQPLVVLAHDRAGEGYHGNHATAGLATVGAAAAAPDPNLFPDQLDHYVIWRPRRLFVHLHDKDKIVHAWDPQAVAVTNRGLACHKSQGFYQVHKNSTDWGLWRFGPERIADNNFFHGVAR